jgi:hypothetical protein
MKMSKFKWWNCKKTEPRIITLGGGDGTSFTELRNSYYVIDESAIGEPIGGATASGSRYTVWYGDD